MHIDTELSKSVSVHICSTQYASRRQRGKTSDSLPKTTRVLRTSHFQRTQSKWFMLYKCSFSLPVCAVLQSAPYSRIRCIVLLLHPMLPFWCYCAWHSIESNAFLCRSVVSYLVIKSQRVQCVWCCAKYVRAHDTMVRSVIGVPIDGTMIRVRAYSALGA